MTKSDDLNRRKFLKKAGLIMGGSVIACGGLSYFGLRAPSSVDFPEEKCGTGMKKILVCYESKAGATGEVAARIADELCSNNYIVDLVRAGNINSLEGYAAAVLGTPVYMGKIMNGINKVADRFESSFASIPTAIFALGLTMKEDTAENREAMMDYVKPLSDILSPEVVGLFGGRIAHETLPPLYRAFSKADAEGILAEGDFRDWGSIDRWAADLSRAWA